MSINFLKYSSFFYFSIISVVLSQNLFEEAWQDYKKWCGISLKALEPPLSDSKYKPMLEYAEVLQQRIQDEDEISEIVKLSQFAALTWSTGLKHGLRQQATEKEKDKLTIIIRTTIKGGAGILANYPPSRNERSISEILAPVESTLSSLTNQFEPVLALFLEGIIQYKTKSELNLNLPNYISEIANIFIRSDELQNWQNWFGISLSFYKEILLEGTKKQKTETIRKIFIKSYELYSIDQYVFIPRLTDEGYLWKVLENDLKEDPQLLEDQHISLCLNNCIKNDNQTMGGIVSPSLASTIIGTFHSRLKDEDIDKSFLLLLPWYGHKKYFNPSIFKRLSTETLKKIQQNKNDFFRNFRSDFNRENSKSERIKEFVSQGYKIRDNAFSIDSCIESIINARE